MNIPTNLKYSDSDEWVLVEGNVATIGISDFAQSQLSDIVYVEFKVDVGDEVKKDSIVVTLDSAKATADVNLPVSGKVVGVHTDLPDIMERINSDPYGDGWMLKIQLSNPGELAGLKDAAAYDTFCQKRSH
jgi:glycine cleavage system H protein